MPRFFANWQRGRSRSIAATMAHARSGVKIAVRVRGSEDEKPQSGLAHAVQFAYVLFAKDVEISTYLLSARDFDRFDALAGQSHLIFQVASRGYLHSKALKPSMLRHGL